MAIVLMDHYLRQRGQNGDVEVEYAGAGTALTFRRPRRS